MKVKVFGKTYEMRKSTKGEWLIFAIGCLFAVAVIKAFNLFP
jgi:hypothetical protein